ncbi:hypothetical protein SARC_08575 [Sphaeroforma arctica JP610]|uniref:Uncharacterized protein n=1 Tax=Sphaeroforma arctica JP610 TaxID=667725 RepID=A0A0L0FR46_9EUKA|nr:hypothetical protein SARC_08575 [Sphaeroforma arctica JP610]KNC79016.1 hypothetical protein SARC_08575 [Sphaeroforma arctica JP610]|eukprot:XP_014152918.1 hypothetical protein SARC_08575 [Sphaeroforma arctica JP610]
MKYGHVPSTLELPNKPLITAIVSYLEVSEVNALSQTCTVLRRITRDPDIRARAIVNSVGAYLSQEDEEEATTTATISYSGMITRTVLQAYTWGGFEMTTDILSQIHGADAYCVGLVTACEKGWIDVVRWLLPYVVGYNKPYAESNVFYLHSALEVPLWDTTGI